MSKRLEALQQRLADEARENSQREVHWRCSNFGVGREGGGKLGSRTVQVIARTKSEARAKLKRMFRLSRVPVGAVIKEV